VLSAETRVRRAPNVLAERVRGAVVILDPGRGRYVRLNGAGGLLWDALVEPATLEELSARLAEAYAVDAARASADASSFVSALADRELVELGTS
jgi:hypothetical protein